MGIEFGGPICPRVQDAGRALLLLPELRLQRFNANILNSNFNCMAITRVWLNLYPDYHHGRSLGFHRGYSRTSPSLETRFTASFIRNLCNLDILWIEAGSKTLLSG